MNSKTSSIITIGTSPHEHDANNSYVEIHGIIKFSDTSSPTLKAMPKKLLKDNISGMVNSSLNNCTNS